MGVLDAFVAALPDVAGGKLRPAGLAHRPRAPRRAVPAAGSGPRPLASGAGLARAGAGRRDAARDPGPGASRPRHRHRRRDAPGELLEPLRDRAGRASTSTTPARRWTAAATRTRCPRVVGPIRRSGPVEVDDAEVPAGEHRPDDQGDGARAVHHVAAGAGRLLRRRRGPRVGVRRGGATPRCTTCSPRAQTSSSSTSRTCRRARRRRAKFGVTALNRALAGLSGTTAVHLCFGYAAIIHERPSGYSFLPELAEAHVRPDVGRDRPVRAGPARSSRTCPARR